MHWCDMETSDSETDSDDFGYDEEHEDNQRRQLLTVVAAALLVVALVDDAGLARRRPRGYSSILPVSIH